MTLRVKLILIVALVVALYAGFDYAIQHGVLYKSFVELEEDEARQDLDRVVEALHNEVSHLDALVHDWSAWDDTYDFVESRNPAYVDANLRNTTLVNANVTLIYHVRADGQVVSRVFIDPPPGEERLDLDEFPRESRPVDDALHCQQDVEAKVAGFVHTSHGAMLVSSRPIVKSSNEGPIRGTLLMGRLIDEERVKALTEQTRVHFAILPLTGGATLLGRDEEGWRRIRTGSPDALIARDDDTLEAFAAVRDIRGQPIFLVRAEVARAITARGGRAIDFAMFSTLGAGLCILAVIVWMLQRTVVGPLRRLTDHALAIGRGGNLTVRLDSAREDEIGILARELDSMVDQLSRSRQRLVESAHLAGMSEVATEVLHNVGNVLNSVNVSAHVIGAKLKASRSGDLTRISAAFEAHAHDLGAFLEKDPKGQKFPAYLALLAGQLAEERDALMTESASLAENLDHIRDLVMAQQTLAGHSLVLEEVSLAEEVECALRICQGEETSRIRILREFAPVPSVQVSKHKLLQILVNLIRNARQALDDAPVAEKKTIALGIALAPDGVHVRIEVADNGVGIPIENQVAIFAHGFTTREGGHGFGLHSAANAAGEMEGSLRVESAGAGQGAKFILELPLARAAQAA